MPEEDGYRVATEEAGEGAADLFADG